MKRSLFNLIASATLLGFGWLIPHSVFDVTLETSMTTPTPTLVQMLPEMAAPDADGPTPVPTPAETGDPYGELYFTIITPKEYFPPETPPPYVEATYRLVRLPGSCVVGLEECPEAEIVHTPFDMKDVYSNDSSGMTWSPDGRYGLLVTHPEDELSIGKTKEELEQIQTQSPAEFEVSPSTLYLFDSQTDTWNEVYHAERKFFSAPHWSPDGQWIAFSVTNSPWAFHPLDADDGIYIVHPDGSGLKRLSEVYGAILGWIGNSILLEQPQGLYPSIDYRTYHMEMLSLDGEIKPLFESDRMAFYSLAPDGGALLVADSQGDSAGLSMPIKKVDILALDGSVAHTFGAFSNYTSSIYPLAWSQDGSLVAFANQRRVYVGPRAGQSGSILNELAGLPLDGPVQEVYVADDTYMEPSFWNFQFSFDNKYLLMDMYDGIPHFVVVSLETGQAIPLEITGMTSSEQASSFSWRP